MLNRFITALSEAKILVFILIVLSLVLGFFIVWKMEQSTTTSTVNDEEASSVTSPDIILPLDPPLKAKTTSKPTSENINFPDHDEHHHEIDDEEVDIQKLMDEQISNETRKKINERLLARGDQFVFNTTEDGGRKNRNNRWSTVAISLKDDDGNALMVDITSPLPLLKEN